MLLDHFEQVGSGDGEIVPETEKGGLKTRGKREIGMWEELKGFQLGWC